MIIIGIAGGTGSGKTTFVNKLIASLDKDSVAVISQDAYYRNNPELSENDRKQLNYDHPDAIEWELLLKHIHQLQNGETIDQPIYSMITCSREVATHPVKPNFKRCIFAKNFYRCRCRSPLNACGKTRYGRKGKKC